MSGNALFELTSDVDAAVRDGSPVRRARMLAQVAAFFLTQADRLTPEQLGIFDEVLARLMQRADARSLSALSTALAGLKSAPPETIRRLALHEDPTVAIPVLERSVAIFDDELIEIASNRGQPHLMAIAKRERLSEAVTDTVLRHSGKDATRALARNTGARFSRQGYKVLLEIAARDETVSEAVGQHADLPVETLQCLLAKTTPVVRARLLKASAPAVRERVQAALNALPAPTDQKTPEDDLAEARAAIVALNKVGQLNDSSVNRFAIRREYPNVIAALVLLSGAAIEIIAPLMNEESGRGLIIACRASRLNWQTTLAVLNNRRVPPLSKEHLEQAREVFEMLYVSAAQYTIRFEMPATGAARPGSRDNVAVAAGGRR
jgi:uncharacterized protein (DUF2336 family)